MVPFSTSIHNTSLPRNRDGERGQACPSPSLVFKKKELVLGAKWIIDIKSI